MAVSNPLLTLRAPLPFAAIEPSSIEPAIAVLLQSTQAKVDALAATSPPFSFANTLALLDRLSENLDNAMTLIGHLEAVATTPELRAAYNAVLPKVSQFQSQWAMDERLWRLFKTYADSPEARALRGPRRRLLEQTLRNFKRQGAELSRDAKQTLEQINNELVRLCTQFSQNSLDARAAFELLICDERRLTGLPNLVLAAAKADAERRKLSGWRLTLDAPSYIPVLTYADDRELRRQLYLAQARLAAAAPYDNRDIVCKIICLREQKAKLLGYANFVDYVAEERMAKSATRIREFLLDLEERTRPAFERENRELNEFAASLGASLPLEPWDIAYYAEKLRRARFDIDQEALRPYFALDQVLQGMFILAERLFGVRVVELLPGSAERPDTWRDDVRYFSVFDIDGQHLGGFYADLFPHDNKRGGAWMNALLTGGNGQPHVGLICSNITKPLGQSQPLLTHDEVETLFHEFGHLLHHLLSKTELRSQAGTNVAWDFVELPSQIMENWCWERESLDLFARHSQTGQPLPIDVFERLKAARTFRSANATMRQLGFGVLDFELHSQPAPGHAQQLLATARQILQRFTASELPSDYAMVCSFGHLFSGPVGYAAGYYSYKWAEVLDADAFSRFKQAGIFDRQTGRAFVDCILAKGDSADPLELFVDFMGREPNPQALLERSGLAMTAASIGAR